MNKYFAKRAEGDFADTQRIDAEVGHSKIVRKLFVDALKNYQQGSASLFIGALKNLLKELGKRGYTEKPDAIRVTGGRWVNFEDLSRDQILGRFASIQQAVAKWVWKTAGANDDLWMKMVERDLVFRANEIEAVLGLLFEIFDHKGYLAYDYEERGFDAFQKRMLSCLAK